MQDVAQQATGRIITHHISPYHAVQGTEAEVRRIVGRLPGDPPAFADSCEECFRKIGDEHQALCPNDGIVTAAQTFGRALPFKSRR